MLSTVRPLPRAHFSVGCLGLLLAAGSPSGCSPDAPGSSRGDVAGGTAGGGATGSANLVGGSGTTAGTAGSTAGGGSSSGGESAVTGGGGSLSGTAGSAGVAASSGSGSGPVDYCRARPGLAFCETFETAAPGPAASSAAWAPSINGDGTLEIDASIAHGGGQSFKVHGSGFSTFLVLNVGSLLTTPDRPLHLRMYVRLAEAMSAGHNTFVVADVGSAPGTGNAFRLGEMNAMLMYTVSGDTHGALANDNYYTDHLVGAALDAQSWSCIELVLDHKKPEISVALAGADIADLHHTDWPLDAYDSLRFGFEKYAGPVTDIWYDDIAIGTEKVGCD